MAAQEPPKEPFRPFPKHCELPHQREYLMDLPWESGELF
jgi:hypothetical protein